GQAPPTAWPSGPGGPLPTPPAAWPTGPADPRPAAPTAYPPGPADPVPGAPTSYPAGPGGPGQGQHPSWPEASPSRYVVPPPAPTWYVADAVAPRRGRSWTGALLVVGLIVLLG